MVRVISLGCNWFKYSIGSMVKVQEFKKIICLTYVSFDVSKTVWPSCLLWICLQRFTEALRLVVCFCKD